MIDKIFSILNNFQFLKNIFIKNKINLNFMSKTIDDYREIIKILKLKAYKI